MIAAALISASATLISCSEEPSAALEETTPSPEPAIVLDWSDLMPAGEEEQLDELYTEFYDDLERRLLSTQRPLSQAGDGYESIEEGSALDQIPQIGTFNTVAELDGKRVRLPGFVVPLDYIEAGTLQNFLFVPYFGACIHTPPPPPNQIVYVEGEWKFSANEIYEPFWVEGVLETRASESELANAAYTLRLEALLPYNEF